MTKLNTVQVCFLDSKHNYLTSVNGSQSQIDLEKYFVGNRFFVGVSESQESNPEFNPVCTHINFWGQVFFVECHDLNGEIKVIKAANKAECLTKLSHLDNFSFLHQVSELSFHSSKVYDAIKTLQSSYGLKQSNCKLISHSMIELFHNDSKLSINIKIGLNGSIAHVTLFDESGNTIKTITANNEIYELFKSKTDKINLI